MSEAKVSINVEFDADVTEERANEAMFQAVRMRIRGEGITLEDHAGDESEFTHDEWDRVVRLVNEAKGKLQ